MLQYGLEARRAVDNNSHGLAPVAIVVIALRAIGALKRKNIVNYVVT